MSINEIVRKHLRQSQLYQGTHQVIIYNTTESTFIGYYPRGQQVTYSENWPSHIELEIIGTTCRLLRIAIDKQHRGQGHGKKLYEIIENIAKELGCTKINMTPLGTTKKGETRLAYLLQLGYAQIGDKVEKILT